MLYPYSIKEKELTLVCSDQDMSYRICHTALRRKSQHWFAQIRICYTHTALRRKSQHWFAQIRICHTHTALRRKSQHWFASGYVIPIQIKKEPTLVCSDQDMSYSIKEKEPTWFAQIRICHTHTALRRKSQHWFAQIRICHTALRRKSQHWFAQGERERANTGLLRSGYVIANTGLLRSGYVIQH